MKVEKNLKKCREKERKMHLPLNTRKTLKNTDESDGGYLVDLVNYVDEVYFIKELKIDSAYLPLKVSLIT